MKLIASPCWDVCGISVSMHSNLLFPGVVTSAIHSYQDSENVPILIHANNLFQELNETTLGIYIRYSIIHWKRIHLKILWHDQYLFGQLLLP